ncbi:MAG: enoyl-CoA hydratase/isomerase family protein, partial [Chloroflexi bacterium]|nr:enoyl-CoA hydratase/isomerase family protein [Chloroflexota bacterium]
STVKRHLHLWELGKPVIAAVNGWCMGAGSWLALSCHMTIAADDAVFSQPEIRMIDSSSFFWILLAGYKNGLRYALTGDHIDAQEALRIGLVNKVVPRDRLLEEAFSIVERIGLVSPETVKINLQIATRGLEMMGLHNALTLEAELAAMARSSRRYDFVGHMEEARKQGGMRAFLQARDGPFQPEPFGPRSRPRTT